VAYFLSPALARLRAEINTLWPHRDKTSDGWIGDASHAARPSDHNPDWSDGGIVRAVDIDEDLVAGLTAAGEAMPLVNQILRDARTRYVIYEGRIWTRENGWQPYSGVNAHRHHVHVSVRSVGNYDRDASSWGITRSLSTSSGSVKSPATSTAPGRVPTPPAPLDPLEQIMSWYRDRKDFEAWQRRITREEIDAFFKEGGLDSAVFTDINGKKQTYGQVWRFRTSKNEATLAQILGRDVADLDEAAVAKQILDLLSPTLAAELVDEQARRLGKKG
jgi:hypothetical protein